MITSTTAPVPVSHRTEASSELGWEMIVRIVATRGKTVDGDERLRDLATVFAFDTVRNILARPRGKKILSDVLGWVNGQHLPNKVELLVAVHRRLVKCGGPAAATAQALACATLEAKIGWLMTVGGLTAQEAIRARRDAGDADARTAFDGAGKVICPRTEDAAALLAVRPPRPRAKRRTRRRPVATQADQIRGGTMVARKRGNGSRDDLRKEQDGNPRGHRQPRLFSLFPPRHAALA